MSTSLPHNRLARLENFGHSLSSPAYVYRPGNAEEMTVLFKAARASGQTVCLRGAGRSYNDAALNGGGIVLDLQRMNHILDWDPQTGRVRVEPGVTIRELWQHVLPDGWWPPVVSGTMTTSLGGCLAANIHGKNNFHAGPLGEHVVEFTALLPTGAQLTCTPRKNGDLFRAMIGGLGLLGAFTSITLDLKKVPSGWMDVHSWPVDDLGTHLSDLAAAAGDHEYAVGWLDTTAAGRQLGRGQLHAADYAEAGDAQEAKRSLQAGVQELPRRLFALLPPGWMPGLMAPFVNAAGVRLINAGRYLTGLRRQQYRQALVPFQFLLDYIPAWERAYGSGGLIQYQSFLPKESAQAAWTEMLRLSQQRGLPATLGVTKRHRPDGFLLSHAVDGFSLALDFKVTAAQRIRLAALLQEFDRIALEAGGRFYFAKNSETTAETTRRFLGEATVEKFLKLKRRCDPDGLLQSDLARRIFGA